MRSLAAFLALGAIACGTDPGPDPTPDLLSTAGLYAELSTGQLAAGVEAYEPTFELWSDGATKKRWIKLPEGSAIDRSDPDRWTFPIGTKLFKEFSVNGARIETRLIERTGEADFKMVAYVWRSDGSDADPVPDGQKNALGTEHDVPKTRECNDCHSGEPSRVLGYSAIELGTATVAPALGYLHANCGTCHNDQGVAWEDTPLDLRLRAAAQGTVDARAIYATTVGVGVSSWRTNDYEKIVVPGDPERSALFVRMLLTNDERMPPIASEHVDEAGAELIRNFIATLPTP